MDDWMRFNAQLRQASGELALLFSQIPDEEVVNMLSIMQQEMEKRMGQRLYTVWAATWLRRRINGGWV